MARWQRHSELGSDTGACACVAPHGRPHAERQTTAVTVHPLQFYITLITALDEKDLSVTL